VLAKTTAGDAISLVRDETRLPDTALAPAAGTTETTPSILRDWWPLIVSFALAAALVLVTRRHPGRRPRSHG
jgi:hypothetical protein